MIYPLGMMTKAQVLSVLQKTGLKLHPSYKLSKSTHDYPTYYKMRAAFLADPSYKAAVLKTYPLLALDEYRFEELFK